MFSSKYGHNLFKERQIKKKAKFVVLKQSTIALEQLVVHLMLTQGPDHVAFYCCFNDISGQEPRHLCETFRKELLKNICLCFHVFLFYCYTSADTEALCVW